MLHQKLRDEIKDAMMAKDLVRLQTLRNMVTAFMNELVSKGKKPQDVLSDEEVLIVIGRLAKQRKDSIEQFKKGGREDLVEIEQEELEILQKYLPKMMEKEEIIKFIKEKKNYLGINDISQKGIFMSTIMKDLKGKADGSLVKEIVDSIFIKC